MPVSVAALASLQAELLDLKDHFGKNMQLKKTAAGVSDSAPFPVTAVVSVDAPAAAHMFDVTSVKVRVTIQDQAASSSAGTELRADGVRVDVVSEELPRALRERIAQTLYHQWRASFLGQQTGGRLALSSIFSSMLAGWAQLITALPHLLEAYEAVDAGGASSRRYAVINEETHLDAGHPRPSQRRSRSEGSYGGTSSSSYDSSDLSGSSDDEGGSWSGSSHDGEPEEGLGAGTSAAAGQQAGSLGPEALQVRLEGLRLDNVDALEALRLTIQVALRLLHQRCRLQGRAGGGGKDGGQFDGLLQVGQPLPALGACKHYKHSHRWLRFPCCGRRFACDLCHEEFTDGHEMKWANRMVCGFCAVEQGLGERCAKCGKKLAHSAGMSASGRRTRFWEGGQGQRDPHAMNRNDPHKYRGSKFKTRSQKAKRVGQEGAERRRRQAERQQA
ncbi:hypothetical protein WJX72_012215 [[Myrmecia] bisecta]|uniref:CHY-type domain-containing protein n=1 Tax=[Myrmecia] bisecta TaxID=41462 RepID=A0AAW1Q1W8_9CHLO